MPWLCQPASRALKTRGPPRSLLLLTAWFLLSLSPQRCPFPAESLPELLKVRVEHWEEQC